MLWERMIRAAKLDVGLYNEVEQDVNATTQALLVVVIVAVASGIGALLLVTRIPFYGFGGGIGLLIRGVITALIGWAVWSLVTYWVGTTFLKGTATYGELLRCLGFAYTPNALGFFIFIPILGGLISLVGLVWALIAMIIAIRESLDFSTGNAIITAIAGFVIMLIVEGILAAIGIGAAAGFGGLGF